MIDMKRPLYPRTLAIRRGRQKTGRCPAGFRLRASRWRRRRPAREYGGSTMGKGNNRQKNDKKNKKPKKDAKKPAAKK
ncbi:MAG: hypothetical protein NTW19_01650 [Planctomycetota bacterium]|nr:hypothetical protein [Planctomycetota bacterium]